MIKPTRIIAPHHGESANESQQLAGGTQYFGIFTRVVEVQPGSRYHSSPHGRCAPGGMQENTELRFLCRWIGV
jgi:hypothetical protein